jgi:hypothetical protein
MVNLYAISDFLKKLPHKKRDLRIVVSCRTFVEWDFITKIEIGLIDKNRL